MQRSSIQNPRNLGAVADRTQDVMRFILGVANEMDLGDLSLQVLEERFVGIGGVTAMTVSAVNSLRSPSLVVIATPRSVISLMVTPGQQEDAIFSQPPQKPRPVKRRNAVAQLVHTFPER